MRTAIIIVGAGYGIEKNRAAPPDPPTVPQKVAMGDIFSFHISPFSFLAVRELVGVMEIKN